MTEIVRVRVYLVTAGIGLDQYQLALAGLPEGPPIRLPILGQTDMASGYAWIDSIGILPIGGDVALPIRRFEFDRP
jgi:hypothetical protein